MITRLRHALAFLTRLPGGVHPGPDEMTACVPYFGPVGALVGAIGGGVFWLGTTYASASVGAAGALIATALTTGAFHEDGLGDSFDALAGGWGRDQRLKILKDSRHGTFGVLSIVLGSLLKFAALSSLGAAPDAAVAGGVALVVAHTVGRSAAVALMGLLPVARPEGLGADYTRRLGRGAAALGVVPGLVAVGLAYRSDAWLPVLLAALGAAAVGAWSIRKIGGITGDILGAAEQVSEGAVLVAAVVMAV